LIGILFAQTVCNGEIMTAFPATVGNDYTFALAFRADKHMFTSYLTGIDDGTCSSEKATGVRAPGKGCAPSEELYCGCVS
jgi:hypothetical protein